MYAAAKPIIMSHHVAADHLGLVVVLVDEVRDPHLIHPRIKPPSVFRRRKAPIYIGHANEIYDLQFFSLFKPTVRTYLGH